MALILCLETATEICSVGLSEGGKLLALVETDQPMDHAARLTTVISSCMEQAGKRLDALDAVAVSSGPGSYTSLRIGYSTAKGIAYALDIPILEIDTLQALAATGASAAGEPGALYCAMLDARRMEAYYAVYNEHCEPLTAPTVEILSAELFDSWYTHCTKMVFVGNAAEKFSRVYSHEHAVFLPVAATAKTFPALVEQKYAAGEFADTAYCGPIYLKPPNITQSKAIL